jgi:hypothetical protein
MAGGEIRFRVADSRILFCSFDRKTYFELENQPVTVAAARTGDRVEIVSDRRAGSQACYARTIHILNTPLLPKLRGGRPRLGSYQSPTEIFAPRGDMTFSGVVLTAGTASLLLRTRSGQREAIMLRNDTRYLDSGSPVAAKSLQVGTRVFVRAGRTLEGDVEAYQVVWGEIFEPIE